MSESPTVFDSARGHWNTIAPFLGRRRPSGPAPGIPQVFTATAPDGQPLQLTGRFLDGATSNLVIVLHGLGGNTESGYMQEALRIAQELGQRALFLNLRGADRLGHDFNHAGLVQDLEVVFRAPELARETEVSLLGFSLGGHLALSYAAQAHDPRLTRVAAVCSPLDLAATAASFDEPRFSVYRKHVLRSLHEIYTAAYQRRPLGLIPHEARRIWRIRTWDHQIVAPRFGFSSAEDYYANVSVGPKLSAIRVPALYVGAQLDPMVPPRTAKPWLTSGNVESIWVPGAGHLGFRRDLSLGLAGPRGLSPQLLSWLRGAS